MTLIQPVTIAAYMNRRPAIDIMYLHKSILSGLVILYTFTYASPVPAAESLSKAFNADLSFIPREPGAATEQTGPETVQSRVETEFGDAVLASVNQPGSGA